MDKKESVTHSARKRLAELRQDFVSWRGTFKEIAEYMLPRRDVYLLADGETVHTANDGAKKHGKIINGSTTDTIRTIAAGLQAGLTSPSRPWFQLGLADEELSEYAPVRAYLHDMRNRLLRFMAVSNFYGATHSMFTELPVFGTTAGLIEEDFKSIFHVRPFTIGEFMLFLDERYRPAGLYRQFSQTAYQLIADYGRDNVSDAVRSAFDNGSPFQRFEVVHCLEPNTKLNPYKDDARGMVCTSLYFELNADPDTYLRKSGYRTIPFFAPRWFVTGTNTYGDAPGMDALGDVKMLQKMEEEKLQALARMNRPPMNAPTTMKGKGGTQLPGGVNYVDTTGGAQAFTPAYLVNPDVQKIAFEIDRVETRIRRFFHSDLFMALYRNEKTMTAYEAAKIYEEKAQILGPTVERLQPEMLDIVVSRAISIAQGLNLFPPPPREIQGMDLNIQYISLLAQAQKMIGTTAIEQTAAFVGNLAGVFPSVTDKFDADEAVDQYAEAVGAAPKIIRSDDQVAAIRADREKQAAAAQAQATLAQGAESAKVLADTKVGQNSALDALLRGNSAITPALN